MRVTSQPGPKWITIGASVFYRLIDLDEWIATRSVVRGVVAFSNRGGEVAADKNEKRDP